MKETIREDHCYLVKQALTEMELERFREIIRKKIEYTNGSKPWHDWKSLMKDYTSVKGLHDKLKSKGTRVLNIIEIEEVKKMQFMKELSKKYGKIEISDEEAAGWPQIYWRITRPGREEDVGPAHADGWFWDSNDWKMPTGYKYRTKVWISIQTEKGKNGLYVVDSKDIKSDREIGYRVVKKSGKLKPIINKNIEEQEKQLIGTEAGDAIVFGDKLIHGGYVNKGEAPRVSIEFTICHNKCI